MRGRETDHSRCHIVGNKGDDVRCASWADVARHVGNRAGVQLDRNRGCRGTTGQAHRIGSVVCG